MKIAVGSDDRVTIRKNHFGESPWYLVYDILNGQITGKEARRNATVDEEESHHGKSTEVMQLLADCQIFMGQSMGKKSMQNITQTGIECILTTLENADEAVIGYLAGEETPFRVFDKLQQAVIPCSNRGK